MAKQMSESPANLEGSRPVHIAALVGDHEAASPAAGHTGRPYSSF